MSRVFISYRRDDSRWVARALKNKLADEIGEDQVFMDIDSIDPGVDFVDVLEKAVSQIDVMIAIVGPQFLTVEDERGVRRLDNPNDFVRLEIAAALKRDIRVIPLLESGTLMPREDELPDDLKSLTRRNAVAIGEASFDSDVDRIVVSLKRLWGSKQTTEQHNSSAAAEPTAAVPGSVRTDGPIGNRSAVVADPVAPSLKSPSLGCKRNWAIPLAVIAVLAILGGLFALRPTPDKTQVADGSQTEPAILSPSVTPGESAPSPQAPPARKRPPTPATEPDVAEPDVAEPDVAEPDVAEPDVAEPDVAEPDVAEPDVAEPDVAEPDVAEPDVAEPDVTPVPDVESPASPRVTEPAPPKTALKQPIKPAEVEGMVWIAAAQNTKGFYMGIFEITQQQYRDVMNDEPSHSKKSDGPVEKVKWKDAMDFCAKLNEMNEFSKSLGIGQLPEGFSFTLPTEAQWEFACRAGNSAPLEDEELYKVAVCYEKYTEGWTEPKSVGSKDPNAWGLFDMLGNVEEWCLDARGNDHVARGGYYGTSKLDVSKSSTYPPTTTAQYVGFRVAAVRSEQP